jgi:hypothetical protein
MISNTSKRRIGVRYAKENKLDYKKVYELVRNIEVEDEGELIYECDRVFKQKV